MPVMSLRAQTCAVLVVAIISRPPRALSTGMSSTPSRPSGSRQSRRTNTTRPWTGQSRSGTTRPGTARPQTAASTRHEGSYVIALLESRGVAHEVGIAAMDKDTGRVMLIQVGFKLELSLARSNRLHRLIWVMCCDFSSEAGRLSNVHQDAASNAHSLSLACSCPGHVHRCYRCDVGVCREEATDHVLIGPVYYGGVS